MRLRTTLSLLLILLVLGLPTMAQASPPDQTWIGGFYDDADFDDIVARIVAEPSAPAVVVDYQDPHCAAVWILGTPDERLAPTPAPLPSISRGPPLS